MVKGTTENLGQNIDIFSNTSPRVVDTIKTWMQVCDILQYDLENCPEDSNNERDETQDTKLKYVAQSELHNIVT